MSGELPSETLNQAVTRTWTVQGRSEIQIFNNTLTKYSAFKTDADAEAYTMIATVALAEFLHRRNNNYL